MRQGGEAGMAHEADVASAARIVKYTKRAKEYLARATAAFDRCGTS
jgi:hypothetical protein